MRPRRVVRRSMRVRAAAAAALLGVALLAQTLAPALVPAPLASREPLAAPRAEAANPLAAIARALFRGVRLSLQRGRAYEHIEAWRRDTQADIDRERQILDHNHISGHLDDATYESENRRLQALDEAVVALAEQQKYLTGQFAKRDIRSGFIDALPTLLGSIDGLDPKAVSVLSRVAAGDRPVEAVLGAALERFTGDSPALKAESIEDFQREWLEGEVAFRVMRSPLGRELRARYESILARANRFLEQRGVLLPGEVADRVRQLQQELDEFDQFVATNRAAFQRWQGAGLDISPERFERNTRWRTLRDAVQALAISNADAAVLLGFARGASDRIEEILAAEGIELTEEQIDEIILAVAIERRKLPPDEAVALLQDESFTELVLQAAREILAAAGVEVATAAATAAAATPTAAPATPPAAAPTATKTPTAAPTPTAAATPATPVAPSAGVCAQSLVGHNGVEWGIADYVFYGDVHSQCTYHRVDGGSGQLAIDIYYGANAGKCGQSGGVVRESGMHSTQRTVTAIYALSYVIPTILDDLTAIVNAAVAEGAGLPCPS